MAARKFRHASNFAVTTIALFIILVVVNLFASRHFLRWDLTANREYTISQTTRDLLAGLENIINVRVYLSKDLPAELLTFERQLRDLLTEYETYGKGKLRIEYIAPDSTPGTQQELMLQGVRAQAVAVYKKDTATQAQVYDSIVVQFENQREVIPSLIDEVGRGRVGLIGDFEYLLTSKIFKCQRTGHAVIGWLTNAPKIDLNKDYKALRDIVRREWDVRDVRFEQAARIAPDIAVLVVIAPQDMTDAQRFEVDQYAMRGGKLLALVETYERDYRNDALQGLIAKPTNFTRLLEAYGLKVNQDVVMDRLCARAPVGRGVAAAYEYWVKIVSRGLSKENPAVSRLSVLILPWTQSLDKAASAPASVEMIPLAQTTAYSTVQWGERITPDPRFVNPQESSKTAKPRTVIAALTGTFPSAFPQGTPYPTDPATTASAGQRTPENERKYSSIETRMVVVGNSLFLQDDFLRITQFTFEPSNNLAFFMNTIEWLALGKGLGQIRAREWASHPINPKIPDWQRTTYKIAGTFAMPIVVVVSGVVYNMIRRRRRRAIADRLLGT
jgi:gliding-associated putative ABC transporter substrate-binding component GldG